MKCAQLLDRGHLSRFAGLSECHFLEESMKRRGFTRRAFLTTASAAIGAATITSAQIPQKLGAPRRQYGERSPYETSSRYFHESITPGTGSSRTPLQDLYGIITPSALHFERHH